MSLKVWVKQGGMTDEEALGIYVPVDGTAKTVVEACQGVFRNLHSSQLALRTEDGIIVALASPASALRSHTLELIRIPSAGATKRSTCAASPRVKGELPTRQQPSSHKVDRTGIAVSNKGPLHRKPTNASYYGKQDGRVASKEKELATVGMALALLWDGLPAFTPPPLGRCMPTAASVLRDSRCAPSVDTGRSNDVVDCSPCAPPSIKASEECPANQVAMPSRDDGASGIAMCVNTVRNDEEGHSSGLKSEMEGMGQEEEEGPPSSSAIPPAITTATETAAAIMSASMETGESLLELALTQRGRCGGFDGNHYHHHHDVNSSMETKEESKETKEIVGADPTSALPRSSSAYFNEW